MSIKELSVIDLVEVLEEQNPQTFFVDIREEYETQEGMIAGFVNIPMSGLRSELPNLQKHKTVYLLCLSGARSGSVALQLKDQETNFINIHGGISAWMMQGLPVVTGGKKIS